MKTTTIPINTIATLYSDDAIRNPISTMIRRKKNLSEVEADFVVQWFYLNMEFNKHKWQNKRLIIYNLYKIYDFEYTFLTDLFKKHKKDEIFVLLLLGHLLSQVKKSSGETKMFLHYRTFYNIMYLKIDIEDDTVDLGTKNKYIALTEFYNSINENHN